MYAIQTESIPSPASPLSLTGPCGYAIENDRIVITIAEIANRRDLGNLSGTLAIELWALGQPYSGGDFTGTPLCGTSIGELRGQHVLTNCRYDLTFQAPPPGTWSLALMLREWTAAGYLTRDYVSFVLPYVVERKPTILRGERDNVISVEFAGNRACPATPAEPTTSPPPWEGAPQQAAAPRQCETPHDPAIPLDTAGDKELAAVTGVRAKLLKMVRQFIKL
jgi:hypothetical protein